MILVFVDYWNMIEQPLVFISDTHKQPLSLILSGIGKDQIGLIFAAGFIYLLPVILVFMHGQKHLVSSIKSANV